MNGIIRINTYIDGWEIIKIMNNGQLEAIIPWKNPLSRVLSISVTYVSKMPNDRGKAGLHRGLSTMLLLY